MPARQRILIIKLGALGDVIMALGPIAAIRRHHPDAHITLLTTRAFADLARACPDLDEVWIDTRPSLFKSPIALWQLRRRLLGGRFDMVYDLQTSDRSSFYFQLMWPRRPAWSGIAKGASHPHANPRRDFIHTIDRQRDQLAFAGIQDVPLPDLSWLDADISGLGLDDRPLLLLVPGGSAHRPEKRWPAARYGELAAQCLAQGWQVAVLGSKLEAEIAADIRQIAPDALDLTGRTGFAELASLGRRATHAVGNDTGPMHILTVAGAPSTVLFSGASDPALTQPVGAQVTVLRRERLADLGTPEVAATVLTA